MAFQINISLDFREVSLFRLSFWRVSVSRQKPMIPKEIVEIIYIDFRRTFGIIRYIKVLWNFDKFWRVRKPTELVVLYLSDAVFSLVYLNAAF